MRSTFLRIFVAFWVAAALIGATLVLLAVTTDPKRADFEYHGEKLAAFGHKMVRAYEEGGAKALRRLTARPRPPREGPLPRRAGGKWREGHRPIYLFQDGEGPLSGRRAKPRFTQLAARAAITGEKQSFEIRGGSLLAMPIGDGYTVVTEVGPRRGVEKLFDPYGLAFRLLITFPLIGLISYLLARSLSTPIRKVRVVANKLAQGDLSARVDSEITSRRDEAGELGRDLDLMASRIESLLSSQQRLLRDISHELRSPLARLGVALELARQRSGAEAAAPLERIDLEAQRLNELIGQLLSLTKIGQGSGAYRETEVAMDQLVAAVVKDADFEAGDRGSRVIIAASVPVTLRGDEELLKRALENIVRNALRFAPETTAVEVTLLKTETSALISVRDRGPGVAPEKLASLFKPFFRVDEGRDRNSGGVGLGLAIAEAAIAAHKGFIRAENHPEGGLQVTVELPLGN